MNNNTDNKMKKHSRKCKGELGYIKWKKRRELVNAITTFAIAAAVFILGLCLNKFEKNNIFSIIAALIILPGVRMIVGFILFFPYHSVEEEQYKRVRAAVDESNTMYCDMVITSSAKVMNLAFMVVTSDKILMLTGRDKEDCAVIEEYIGSAARKRGCDYTATAVNDEGKFISMVKKAEAVSALTFEDDDDKNSYEGDRHELCAFLESLMA